MNHWGGDEGRGKPISEYKINLFFLHAIQTYNTCRFHQTLIGPVKDHILPDYKRFCRRVTKLQVEYQLNTSE